MPKRKKKKSHLASLSLYEHDSLEDVVERLEGLLLELGYEMAEEEVDPEDDEIDLYARFNITEGEDP